MQSACLTVGCSFLPPTSIHTLDNFVSQAAHQIGEHPDAAADIGLAAAAELLNVRELQGPGLHKAFADLINASCKARDQSLRP